MSASGWAYWLSIRCRRRDLAGTVKASSELELHRAQASRIQLPQQIAELIKVLTGLLCLLLKVWAAILRLQGGRRLAPQSHDPAEQPGKGRLLWLLSRVGCNGTRPPRERPHCSAVTGRARSRLRPACAPGCMAKLDLAPPAEDEEECVNLLDCLDGLW